VQYMYRRATIRRPSSDFESWTRWRSTSRGNAGQGLRRPSARRGTASPTPRKRLRPSCPRGRTTWRPPASSRHLRGDWRAIRRNRRKLNQGQPQRATLRRTGGAPHNNDPNSTTGTLHHRRPPNPGTPATRRARIEPIEDAGRRAIPTRTPPQGLDAEVPLDRHRGRTSFALRDRGGRPGVHLGVPQDRPADFGPPDHPLHAAQAVPRVEIAQGVSLHLPQPGHLPGERGEPACWTTW